MADTVTDKWHSGGSVNAASLLDIQPGGVVSRTIVKKKPGTVTVFAFGAGQGSIIRLLIAAAYDDVRSRTPR